MQASDDLLKRVEAYLVEHKLTKSQFGALALRQPCFVDGLRRGRKVRETTIARIDAFMASPPPAPSRGSINASKYRRAVDANARAALEQAQHRTTDLFERARTYLQARGYVIFHASVFDPSAEDYIMGRRRVTAEDVIASAQAKGFA